MGGYGLGYYRRKRTVCRSVDGCTCYSRSGGEHSLVRVGRLGWGMGGGEGGTLGALMG